MSTDTKNLSDTELQELVEHEKKCECYYFDLRTGMRSSDPCPNAANWLYLYRCCDNMGFACDTHYNRHVAGTAWTYLRCQHCKHTIEHPQPFSDLVKAVYPI